MSTTWYTVSLASVKSTAYNINYYFSVASGLVTGVYRYDNIGVNLLASTTLFGVNTGANNAFTVGTLRFSGSANGTNIYDPSMQASTSAPTAYFKFFSSANNATGLWSWNNDGTTGTTYVNSASLNTSLLTVQPTSSSSIMQLVYKTTVANTTVGLIYLTTPNVLVDWGDASSSVLISSVGATHVYATAGTYTVKVSGSVAILGDIVGVTIASGLRYLTDILSFGDLGITRITWILYSLNDVNTFKLNSIAQLPTTVTDLQGAFEGVGALVDPVGLSDWDVSRVGNFSRMFVNCNNLKTNLSNWRFLASSVVLSNFLDTVNPAIKLNPSNWYMGNVTTMYNCLKINTYSLQIDNNLGNWDIRRINPGSIANGFYGIFNMSTANTNATLIGWKNQTINSLGSINWAFNFTGINAIDAFLVLNNKIGFTTNSGVRSVEVISSLGSNTFDFIFFPPASISLMGANTTYYLDLSGTGLSIGNGNISAFTSGATINANSVCRFLNIPKINSLNSTVSLRVKKVSDSSQFGPTITYDMSFAGYIDLPYGLRIISVSPTFGGLNVNFRTSRSQWEAFPVYGYYYSINGGSTYSLASISLVDSSSCATFSITDITTTPQALRMKTATVMGNTAETTYGSVVLPYSVGTAGPSITSIQSILNGVKVFFTGSVGASPTPYYYYSVDGGVYSNTFLTASGNFTIPSLSGGQHSFSVMGVSIAGNLASGNVYGYTASVGIQPNIVSVAPTANSITVSFQQSYGAYPDPIYYYSLTGNVATGFANAYSSPNSVVNLTANTIVISNIYTTAVQNVFLLAQNLAGNVYSNNVVQGQSSTLGTAPAILNVYSNLNSVLVRFTAAIGGYPTPTYYYSVDGGAYVNSGLTSNTGNMYIPSLTVSKTYSIRLMSSIPAGNLFSGTATGQPFTIGTQPNLISVSSSANGLAVSFEASTGGYPTPAYYYSLNGGIYSNANITGLTASSFTIGNLFTSGTYSVSVGAISAVGSVYSASTLSGQPYVLGTVPVITRVQSNINSLTVDFNASVGGYTDPVYYYSVAGSTTFVNTGLTSNTTSITIGGFTQANTYGVRLIAVNPAGNLISNSVNGQPYIIGSQPNITSVSPLANSLSISFQPSLGGYDSPIYYYSLDGGATYSNTNVVSQSAGIIVVGGLTTAANYSVGMLAVNSAGNAYSSGLSSGMPYVVGTAVPVITQITSGVNSMIVSFTGSSGANPAPYYYYSVDGGAFVNSGKYADTDPIIVPNSVLGNHAVRLMAVNPAGNLVSTSETGQPYVVGSRPNIDSVVPLANALTVSFQPSVGGYDVPSYYYSIAGNSAGAYVALDASWGNVFTVDGLTTNTTRSISMLAVNSAGNVYSGTVVQATPYVVGSEGPAILNVYSNVNSLLVRFASSQNANPAPYYYYSVNGGAFINSGLTANTANIYIPGLTTAGVYTIQLMAVNPAGNLVSASSTGQPYVVGSQPNIDSVVPLANALTVSFQPSVGGYDAPSYYYSIAGNSAGSYVALDASWGNVFTVGGLTTNTTRSISMLAVNSAGNVYSGTVVQGTPYVVGSFGPAILNVYSNVNSLLVRFASSQNANPAPYYYYSVNGGAFINSDLTANTANIYIPGLTTAGVYTIQLMAVNPAGNVASASSTGQPYVVGSQPNIIGVDNQVNALSVRFQGVSGWNPLPSYYYSIDGGSTYTGTVPSGNAFTVSNLFVANTYYVSFFANNLAGYSYSGTVGSGDPYVLGTRPNISSVVSLANGISVGFQTSTGGYPAPTYYYSLDGGTTYILTSLEANANVLVLSGLTTATVYNVGMLASSVAGNAYSARTVSGQPFVLGTRPNIANLQSNLRSLTVAFSASIGAYPNPQYYYSVDGGSYVDSGLTSNASTITIPNLTVAKLYTVRLMATNPAGSLYSDLSSQTPYIVGTQPNITSVASLANGLSIGFQTSTDGYPAPTYYYSLNGGTTYIATALEANANVLVLSGLTTATVYNVGMLASSVAGNAFSAQTVSGQPYVLGTRPNITILQSNLRSLVVSFSASVGAYPDPQYYYSVDGGSYVDSGLTSNASSITIPNLTVAKTYSVRLMATNPAGSLYSDLSSQIPYIVGTQPNITSIVSLANGISVGFQTSTGGYPAPTYYYTVDGGTTYVATALEANANVLVLSGLTTATVYNVGMLASSVAGNAFSAETVSGQPFVLGTRPSITNLQSNLRSLVVSFSASVGAYPSPQYYYSVDGGSYVDSGLTSNASSITIPNLTVAKTYSVRLMAVNPAGNLISDASSQTPYIVGTHPNITSVVSLANGLSIGFQTSVAGYPAPTYYYTVDGGSTYTLSSLEANANVLVLSGLTTATIYNVGMLASSVAGNAFSAQTVSGQPFVLGTRPSITNLQSNLRSLVVSFSASIGAYPDPQYYYSVDGGSYVDSGLTSNASSITIPNLTVAKLYNVRLMATNPAGSLYSDLSSQIPYIVGTQPNITSVASLANGISVGFQTSTDGYPAPTYYYSLDGGTTYVATALEANANVLVLSGLTTATVYNVGMLASSVAGNAYSARTVSGQPFVLGTRPSITNLQSNLRSLTVSFSASIGAYPDPQYYYSVDGGSYVDSGLNSNLTAFTIPNLTVARAYAVRLMATNPAGSLYSDLSSQIPYIVGTRPNITSVVSLANGLSIGFQTSTDGYPAPTYYYSLNGGSTYIATALEANANVLVLSGLTTATVYNVGMLASSVAGNAFSAETVSGQPFVLGTRPSITVLQSNLRSLTVSFSASIGAYPSPQYYYSVDGGSYVDSGLTSNASSITIPNLTVAKLYTVRLMATNPAGNLISDLSSQIPYIVGTQPNITSVVSLANGISVGFQTSTDGYPAPTYYYTVDGGSTYTLSSLEANANVLVLSGLTTATVYNVGMLASSVAGNAFSAQTVSGQPFVLGTRPSITVLQSNLRSLTVSFSASIGAYPSPQYYYSVDGGSYVDSGLTSNVSAITIPNLTVARTYSIRLMATNPAGSLYSDASSQIPYIVGTQPNITSVASLANGISVRFQTSTDGYPAPTYYYTLDGGSTYVATSLEANANTLVLSGLTTTAIYDVGMLASSVAGNAFSTETVIGQPYVLGSVPAITTIYSNIQSLEVGFIGSSGAYPNPQYYYSVDGSAFVYATSNLGTITIPNLTVARAYSVRLMASNFAGNLVSASSSGVPYIVGTAPIVDDVVSRTNSVLIYFTGSGNGNPSPSTYYYTQDGGNTFVDSGITTSPISVGNLGSQTYSFGLIARNTAGNTAVSNFKTGAPYILGSVPYITDVSSGINSVFVFFNESAGGSPAPSTYYYSLDGGNTVANAGTTVSPIVIGNLTTATTYSVKIKAESLAGITAWSNSVLGRPYVIGEPPLITVDSSLNKLIVYFTDISGGYPAPYTYLYSLDGVNYVDANTNVSPITVGNLTTPVARFVSLKAVNMVGTSAVSNTIMATPYVIGNAPRINSLTVIVNGFSVDFEGSTGGYPAPSTYLYSVDGGVNYNDALTNTSPITVGNLSPLQMYDIRLKAVNSGGITAESNSKTGTPFLVVSAPVITDVEPLGNTQLEVFFTPSPGSYPNPFVYLYAFDGGNFMGGECAASPLLIENYVAGSASELTLKAVLEVTSLSAQIPPQYPLVIGTAPVINSVASVLNGISVSFTDSAGGYPAPSTYYYSLDGGNFVDGGANISSLVIGNLNSVKNYSVAIFAQNAGGNSAVSNVGYGEPYIIGSAPTITDVSAIPNGFVVSFLPSAGWHPAPTTYLFSVDGVNYADSGSTTSPITITNLSPIEYYVVSLKAKNAGGLTAPSNSVVATPFSLATAPTITNATASVNGRLTISFVPCPNTTVYPVPVVYYYSLNDDTAFKSTGNVRSPVVVNGITSPVDTARLKGVLEITAVSNQYSGQPYVIGTAPYISRVDSIENGIVIHFSDGSGGYPQITTHYYSIDGGNTFVDALTTTSPITITGFTTAVVCNVVLTAHNLGGNTAVSNLVVQTPYINGTAPEITNVLSEVNGLIVEFNPSVGGFPEPVSYYYSVNGVDFYDGLTATSPIFITGLTEVGVSYGISVKAFNSIALGRESNVVYGRPYVAGNAPKIVSTATGFQEIVVSFANDGAYPEPTEYYYSVDGAGFSRAGQTASPLVVGGLISNRGYAVYIYSVNVAGASAVSAAAYDWTKSNASFFRDVLNPTYNLYRPIYEGKLPDNNGLNTGLNEKGVSTKQKYARYVSGTGRTRR
jgi:hypothetical protein